LVQGVTKFKDMQMVFVPNGLKRAVQALALCVPLAAFEVILVKRAPWWRLPYQQIGYVCVPVFAACVIISILLLKGRRIAWYVMAVLSGFWFLSNGWMALRLHYPSLGIFGLVLGGLMLAHLSWLKLELGRSFIDPKMHWYEGLPQPVPGLNCEVDRNAYRVARLDREGVFVFRDNSRGTAATDEKFKKPENSELLLSFREKQIRCVGVPVCVFDRMGSESVIGFKFRDMSADSRKQLGDFVEALKGEGYVS
jgi:hypothetical protein